MQLIVEPVRDLNCIVHSIATLDVVHLDVESFIDLMGQKLQLVLDMANCDDPNLVADQFGPVSFGKTVQGHMTHYTHI